MCEGGGILTGGTFLAIIFGIVGIILGSLALSEVRDLSVSGFQGNGIATGRDDDSSSSMNPNDHISSSLNSETLGAITNRGTLKCGIPNQPGFAVLVEDTIVGFDADLCRAIAAGIFGESDGHVEFVVIESASERWRYLQDKSVDVMARVTTHTMERDVNEPTVGVGFEFSPPYLYNGVGFGGVPPYGACADSRSTAAACSNLLICVIEGTTHVPIVRSLFPAGKVLPVQSSKDLYVNMMNGNCNAIAEEQTGIAEPVVRLNGYEGEYEVGSTQYSKEPLAVVTREGDSYWTDFVFWIIEALIYADELKIPQTMASDMPETFYFGPSYQQMYQNAIKDVGNYGEMYARHLENIVSRSDLNTVNSGGSGIIYSFPFGSLLTVGKGPVKDGTIDQIKKRGHLKCGITTRNTFGDFNRTQRTWSGFDVDMCRALSAAIFDGVDHVVFVDLPATDRFVALATGQVDCLSRITTLTQERDRAESTTGAGFSFSPVYFYDGLSFGGRPPFRACAEALDSTSTNCTGLKICLVAGTTTIARAREVFPESVLVSQPSGEEVLDGFLNDACNVIGGGTQDIAEGTVRSTGYLGSYEVGTTRFSKEPLAIVTRENDYQWTNFVRWIVHGMFFAEEEGITQENATLMPRTDLFGGLLRGMFIQAINAVGNYGEIYERNLESLVPRGTGLNSLNSIPAGPQQYPLVF